MNQPLAYVHPQARVAKNAVIEPFVNIERNVEIGEGTWIGSNVTIMEGVRIGKNCKVFPGAVIGAIPQDLKYEGEDTTVEIGDNVVIREFVTINRGTKANWKTVIGNNCLLMAYVHIAHDCILENNVILANAVNLAGHIEIKRFAIVGGLSAVHQFVKIGEGCMIGGASAISQDIPPFCLAEGNRAVVKGLNAVGIKRRFVKEDIRALQGAYRKLFRSGLPIKEVATELMKNEKNEKVKQICSFILETKRGIPYERKN